MQQPSADQQRKSGRLQRGGLGQVAAITLMILVGFAVLAVALLVDPWNRYITLQDPTPLGMARMAFGTLALFTLPFYRKFPLVPIIAGIFCAAVMGTDPYVLSIGLAVMIGRAQQRWQWLVIAIGAIAFVVNVIRVIATIREYYVIDRSAILILASALYLLCASTTVGIGMWSRQRRRADIAADAACRAQSSNEQLSGELARQREREELAREVHDTLASRLSAIALQVGSLEEVASESGSPELDDGMRKVRANATNALGDLRSLLTTLREGGGATTSSPPITPTGLSDVSDLLEDAEAAGLDVKAGVFVTDLADASEALRRAVVRITQEALTNALRYSSDRAVDVSLQGAPEEGIRLAFSNSVDPNGSGFEGGSGTGLKGVRERVELLGGSMEARSSDGVFTLAVNLPWEE